MKSRLLLGPLMIALLVGVLALDQWVETRALPEALRVGGLTTFPPGTIVVLVCVGVAIWAARELAGLLHDKGIEASKRVITFAALTGLGVSCLVPSGLRATVAVEVVSTSAIVVLGASLLFYSRHKSFQGIVAAAGGVLLAYVYLGLMFGFVLAIRREHSVWLLLWVILVIKSCDIGAYFTGKSIGRHKLIPWLSPGKTWEGLFGGIALSCVSAVGGLWVLQRFAGEAVPPLWHGLVPGVLFALLGQLGDLTMSLFKRDAGLKDSGKSLAGYGGILDVLDSPLLVTPAAYWWLQAMM